MPKNPKKPNKTKRANKALITKAIADSFKKHDKMPSLAEISEATGIGRQTVSSYMDDLTLPKALESYRLITDDVMSSMLRAIDNGNAQAMKLFFQLVWSWKPPKMNDPSEHQQHQQVIYEIRGEEPPSQEETEAREKERQEWQERIEKSNEEKRKELDDLFYDDSNSGKWMPDEPGTL